jgi:hypothetical protein
VGRLDCEAFDEGANGWAYQMTVRRQLRSCGLHGEKHLYVTHNKARTSTASRSTVSLMRMIPASSCGRCRSPRRNAPPGHTAQPRDGAAKEQKRGRLSHRSWFQSRQINRDHL